MRRIFTFFFSFLLIVAFVRSIYDFQFLTLKDILDIVSNIETFQPVMIFQDVSLGDWGTFNFLRDMLYQLIGSISIVAYVGQSIASALVWIAQFIWQLCYKLFIASSVPPDYIPPPGGGGGRWSLLLR